MDNKGCIHGRDRLRIFDASIIPSITTRNLNAPKIMVAEKLVDMILGVEPLAPLEADVWSNPEWKSYKR